MTGPAHKITQAEAAQELLRRRKARDDGGAYREYVSGLYVARHSRLIWDKLNELKPGCGKRLMFFLPPGSAKPLALDTPIATTAGWKTMGTVAVGDYVFDENGQPTRVTWKSDVMRDRDVYAVTTNDGESIIATGDHPWPVRLCRKYKKISIRDTEWLFKNQTKDRRPRAIIPAKALEMPDRADLTIDPYVLGVWLGDGSVSCGGVTTADEFIVGELWRLEGNVRDIGSDRSGKARSYRFGPNGRGFKYHLGQPLHFYGRLKQLGVIPTKHIPDRYMFASKQQRLSLLQGLIDTDGSVSHIGHVTFTNKNKRLAEQVRELVFSLGVKASFHIGRARFKGMDYGEYYKISFFMKDAARLPRKRVWCRDALHYMNRFIRVEQAGTADVACIRVDAPSHLFLCGRTLLPTHNTTDISHHFPAYYLTKYPEYPIIGATHTDKFAEQNGRRVRGIVMSDEHRRLFPDIQVREDSAAAARWELSNGGMYMGFGVGATVVGRRAGGLILDDVVAGIAAADSQTERDFVWNWWGADLSTRLVPGGWVCLVMTRYHPDDIAGRLLAAATAKFGDKWEVISLPALAKDNDPLGRKPGEALWPEWQNEKELIRIKNQPHMTARMWAALYQQEPVAESGNIVQRAWFKLWRSKEPPECKYIIQSWDTAATQAKQGQKTNSAYSSCLTFGVFDEPETGLPSIILLSRWRDRVDYHDLKAMARRLAFNYLDDRRDMPMRNPSKMPPDVLLIEDESSGKPLLQEFARAGIQAFAFPSRKYGNKDARLQLSLDIIEAGRVYLPAIPPMFTQPRKFADEFVTSVTAYPASPSRDDVDAMSQAIIRLKTSGWIYQAEDRPPPPAWRPYRPPEPLYG